MNDDSLDIRNLPPLQTVPRQAITARYKPLPDITAYEVALILPGLFGKPLFEEDWAALGTAVRHFERIS